MSPEPLHQLLKGLMENAIEMNVEKVGLVRGKDGVRLLDKRMQSLRPSRQSERRAFPISTFPKGLSNLSKIQGQEYPAAILQLMAVLAGDLEGDLMDRGDAKLIVKALDGLYRLWMYLEAEAVPKEDILSGAFQQRVQR